MAISSCSAGIPMDWSSQCDYLRSGIASLHGIAVALNNPGIRTARGGTC